MIQLVPRISARHLHIEARNKVATKRGLRWRQDSSTIYGRDSCRLGVVLSGSRIVASYCVALVSSSRIIWGRDSC